MTVLFTDEEMEWINKDMFNWNIKDGCPSKLRKSIKKKLEYLKENSSYGKK